MTKVFYLLLASLIAFSCSRPLYTSQVREIDSLLIQVDSLAQYLSHFNIDSMQVVLEETREVNNQFRNFIPETNKNEFLQDVGHYGNIHRALNKFLTARNHFQKELSFTEEQLKSLRHDLEYELLADSLAEKYLREEKDILSRLAYNLKALGWQASEKMELYKQVYPRVTQYADSIQELSSKLSGQIP
jgi:RNA binding exosome subunit